MFLCGVSGSGPETPSHGRGGEDGNDGEGLPLSTGVLQGASSRDYSGPGRTDTLSSRRSGN